MKLQLRIVFLALSLLLTGITTMNAQQKLKFSVASFELDQFDMTARKEVHKKTDGNGNLFSIIKVTSTNPDDDLKAYHFSFGNMNHEVVEKDGELWVYVQRNAKMVTISRQGYATINRYDLQTTIEEGRVYTMHLSTTAAKIHSQMVMFSTEPIVENAAITITKPGGDEDVIGTTDETGGKAASLPFGKYTYKVLAEGYYPSSGGFTLNDEAKTHIENITLKAKFGTATLRVNATADIYVNGELKGNKTWTGRLNSGQYQVECRQDKHHPSTRIITIEENALQTFDLDPPSPITGTASVNSTPLRGEITIDGQSYGLTPRNITDLIIGQHTIKISKDGYNDVSKTFEIIEGQTTKVELTMNKSNKATSVPQITENNQLPSRNDNPIIVAPQPLNKTFDYRYNGVTFRCKAKRGYITITKFDTGAANVTIPGKVEFGGNEYPVKEIDTFINGNNYSATKLVIEEGVETIANYAFNEFRKLTDVTIPSSIKTIGRNAFRDIKGLTFHLPAGINESSLRSGKSIKK